MSHKRLMWHEAVFGGSIVLAVLIAVSLIIYHALRPLFLYFSTAPAGIEETAVATMLILMVVAVVTSIVGKDEDEDEDEK